MKQQLKWLALFGLCAFSSASFANQNFIIHNYFHPNTEPKGLYIVNFDYYDYEISPMYKKKLTYRVYCPTKTVRDITSGKIDKARTAVQEDRHYFGNKNVLQAITKQVCFKAK